MPDGKIRRVVHLHQREGRARYFFVRMAEQVADERTAERRFARPQPPAQGQHVAGRQQPRQPRGERPKFRFIFNALRNRGRDGWHLRDSCGT